MRVCLIFVSFVDISGTLIMSVLMRICMRRAKGMVSSFALPPSKEVLAGFYLSMQPLHQPKGALISVVSRRIECSPTQALHP
jgi:hypothetical protein